MSRNRPPVPLPLHESVRYYLGTGLWPSQALCRCGWRQRLSHEARDHWAEVTAL